MKNDDKKLAKIKSNQENIESCMTKWNFLDKI